MEDIIQDSLLNPLAKSAINAFPWAISFRTTWLYLCRITQWLWYYYHCTGKIDALAGFEEIEFIEKPKAVSDAKDASYILLLNLSLIAFPRHYILTTVK